MEYSFNQIIKDENLVRKVNRIFHDFEAESYEQGHPEIYRREVKNWHNNYWRYIKPIRDRAKEGITILDVGTGNGFVVESLGHFFTPNDLVIFSDISPLMLNRVKKKFDKNQFKKEYLLSDTTAFDLLPGSVDVITINSVLHHLPSAPKTLSVLGQLLKKGGLIIIRHEPNRLFAENTVLRSIYKIINYLKYMGSNKVWPINTNLLKKFEEEGIKFEDGFDYKDLIAIVDIESPTARGGLDRSRGFNPFVIKQENFADYQVIINTYNFFGKIDENGSLGRRLLSRFLKLLFPYNGYLFELIAIK